MYAGSREVYGLKTCTEAFQEMKGYNKGKVENDTTITM